MNNNKSTNRILKTFYTVIGRLPSTYPKPKLVVHKNLRDLRRSFYGINKQDNVLPYAFCDCRKNSVHVVPSLNNEAKYTIAWYLLHEIGHLRAIQRYGPHDPKWDDYKSSELYADRFASRWCNRLEEEGVF